MKLLVSNKHREDSRRVELPISGLPEQWSAALKTMGNGDDGFVYRGMRQLRQGCLALELPPSTIALVSAAAGPEASWQYDRVMTQD